MPHAGHFDIFKEASGFWEIREGKIMVVMGVREEARVDLGMGRI